MYCGSQGLVDACGVPKFTRRSWRSASPQPGDVVLGEARLRRTAGTGTAGRSSPRELGPAATNLAGRALIGRRWSKAGRRILRGSALPQLANDDLLIAWHDPDAWISTSSSTGSRPRWRSRAAVRFASRGPHGTAQGLVQLLDDLADDELRALLARGWARERAYVATLLGAADLPRLGDPAVAATLVVDVLNGALLRAAADPLPDAVGRALDELLEVWT